MKKKVLLFTLLLCFLACFRTEAAEAKDQAAMNSAIEIGLDEVVSLSKDDTTWCVKVNGVGTLTIEAVSGYDFRAYIWNESGTVDDTKELIVSNSTLHKGVYEITKPDTFYIQAAGVGRTLKASFEEKIANADFSSAVVIDVPMDGELTIQTSSSQSEFYRLEPDDKSYYEITKDSNTYVYVYDLNNKKLDYYSENYNYDTGVDNSYIFTAYKKTPVTIQIIKSPTSSSAGSMTIKRTDFKEIKTIKFPSKTLKVSGSKEITLNIGNIKNYESKIRYTITDADGNEVNNLIATKSEIDEFTKRHILTIGNNYTVGVYKITATTSEGLTATAEVQLSPAQFDITNNTRSEGTTNSSTVTWTAMPNVDKYYVYLLKNGKYKKVGETADTTYTFKKLKAGKTYSFKIAAVKIVKNAKGKKVDLVGDKSEVWKFITAPAEKPVLSSASAVSTKYYPKSWVEGIAAHWDSFGNWHDEIKGYWVDPYSVATVEINVKSSKNFTRYQYEEDNLMYCKNKAKITYSFSGKISSKSQKVKVRGVSSLDKFNSKAYGKWSDAKSVTLKAAK